MSQPQGTEVSLWWITRLYPGWGVFEGGTWATPKPYMPRTICSFQLRMPEGVPLTSSSPDSPYRKTLFIELGQGSKTRMGYGRGSKTRMGFTLECDDVIKSYEYH